MKAGLRRAANCPTDFGTIPQYSDFAWFAIFSGLSADGHRVEAGILSNIKRQHLVENNGDKHSFDRRKVDPPAHPLTVPEAADHGPSRSGRLFADPFANPFADLFSDGASFFEPYRGEKRCRNGSIRQRGQMDRSVATPV